MGGSLTSSQGQQPKRLKLSSESLSLSVYTYIHTYIHTYIYLYIYSLFFSFSSDKLFIFTFSLLFHLLLQNRSLLYSRSVKEESNSQRTLGALVSLAFS
uniref:Uncharacterized protein n=1 Tax=Salix viminalis TaxID=40686 RepID=A0A6N2N7B5_SALVM